MAFHRTYLYLVARIDFFDDEEFRIPRDTALWNQEMRNSYGVHPGRISGTKVFLSIDQARAHANRLNEENKEKGSRYFVLMGRLDEPLPQKEDAGGGAHSDG